MLKLRRASFDWALAHVRTYGDTDVLPVPFEFEAIQHDWDAVRDFCVNQDIMKWSVRPHRTLLAPKAGYGFRVVTQLDPLDLLVFSALIREIVEEVESRRVPLSRQIIYSYRAQINRDGQLFNPSIRYDDFRQRAGSLLKSRKYSHVAVADIADFGLNPTLPKMVARVVDGRPEGERFGPKSVVEEVNRRFRKWLRRPVDPPAVSVVLRRMYNAGRIHQVRPGKANHEALYVKGPRPRPARGEDDS